MLWLYVLPLIADQGLGFGDAAGRSNAMVKGVGWWRTFGMVVVLGLVIGAAMLVILLIAVGIGQAEEWAGVAVGLLLFLVFAILVPPYTICYVSVMYLGSVDAAEPVHGGGLPGIPPAPPAPPAPAAYGTPASPVVAAPAAGAATAVTAAGAPPAPPARSPAGDDAWKAAADPLATAPPPPPVVRRRRRDGQAAATSRSPQAGRNAQPCRRPSTTRPRRSRRLRLPRRPRRRSARAAGAAGLRLTRGTGTGWPRRTTPGRSSRATAGPG